MPTRAGAGGFGAAGLRWSRRVHHEAHPRVLQPAELGAAADVAAGLVEPPVELRPALRERVALEALRRDPERVDHVARDHPEADRAPGSYIERRDPEVVAGDGSAVVRERPAPLERDDADSVARRRDRVDTRLRTECLGHEDD